LVFPVASTTPKGKKTSTFTDIPRPRTELEHEPDPTLDSLQLLLREAGRYPLLKPSEEIELAKRIEKGDLAAKDRMINSNLRLVVANARLAQGVPVLDLRDALDPPGHSARPREHEPDHPAPCSRGPALPQGRAHRA
jgi:hypothetical protein